MRSWREYCEYCTYGCWCHSGIDVCDRIEATDGGGGGSRCGGTIRRGAGGRVRSGGAGGGGGGVIGAIGAIGATGVTGAGNSHGSHSSGGGDSQTERSIDFSVDRLRST